MRFRVDPPLDGHTNMAADRELLERAEAGEAGARVYGWTGAWVSLGRFQRAETDLVDPGRVPWVQRPTGGKAVLHGHDVTVGIAAPLAALGVEGRSLRAAYRAVVAPIIEAMRACAVRAALAEAVLPAARSARTADCFALTSPNDIVDEATGLKVCGCALRLTERAVLAQASIPNGQPLVAPEAVIRHAALTLREWDARGFASAFEAALRATLIANTSRAGSRNPAP